MNFANQSTNTRANSYHHLLCFNTEAYLVPEGVRGLRPIIDDITTVLNSVNKTQQSNSTLADKTSRIILADVEHLVNKIVSSRANLSLGQRSVLR